MLENWIGVCADLNSAHCPCLLAESNHCVMCGQLRGDATCNCRWGGVCVLYEKFWQEKAGRAAGAPRRDWATRFRVQERIGAHTYRIAFDVPEELAGALRRLGSFVFLRKENDPQFCQFPVGVMHVDGVCAEVVVEVVGAKSARLFSDGDQGIIVRGPYFNGILGQPWLESLRGGKAVAVAGGMGQAPALPAVEKLLANGNEVLVVAAPGRVGRIFVADRLRSAGAAVQEVGSLRQSGLSLLRELFSLKPDLLFSAGPDDQHDAVIAAMKTAGVNIPLAATNNATMCCGEGICGSCRQKTKDGGTVTLCKTQTPFAQLKRE